MRRSLVLILALSISFATVPTLSSAAPEPKYSQGDHWEYDISGAYSIKGKLHMEVLAIIPMNYQSSNLSVYVMIVNRTGGSGPGNCTMLLTPDLGRIQEQYIGILVEYSPPFRYFNFPINAGDSYDYQYSRGVKQGNSTVTEQVKLSVKVISFEQVSVDAGSFDSFQIEVTEVGTSSVFKMWYAERAGNLVKYEYWFGDTLSERWSLGSFAYARSPEPTYDLVPIAIVMVGVVLPLLVLALFRKRLVAAIRTTRVPRRSKRKGAKRRGTPGKPRKRFKSDKAYNHDKDKGSP